MKLSFFIFFLYGVRIATCQPDANYITGDFSIKLSYIDSLQLDEISRNIRVFDTNACISDSAGTLQFFTNGVRVFDALGDTLENGTMLLDSLFGRAYSSGSPVQQGAIIFPKRDNQYYLVYMSESDQNFSNPNSFYSDKLCCAIVDMTANAGKGKVLSKRNVIYQGMMGNHRMTACRHANGRDWWLIKLGYRSNEIFRFLITPDSISQPMIQAVGTQVLLPGDELQGQAVFSRDGTQYAFGAGNNPLTILDFDRCTGLFSNPRFITIEMDTYNLPPNPPYLTGNSSYGLSFSPSGRFIYSNTYAFINQYDLHSWGTDSFRTRLFAMQTVSDSAYFGMNNSYLLPNNQILVSSYHGVGRYIHAIDSPDVKGLGCKFIKNKITLPYWGGANISNMPNFRLGSVPSKANQQNETRYFCIGDSVALWRKHYPYSRYKWYDDIDSLSSDTAYTLYPSRDKLLYLELKDSTCSCGNRTDTIRLIALYDTTASYSHFSSGCVGDSLYIGNQIKGGHRWYKGDSLISTKDSIAIFIQQSVTYVLKSVDAALSCKKQIDTFNIAAIADCGGYTKEGVYFYPNPASGFIQYQISDSSSIDKIIQVEFVNMLGASVYKRPINQGNGQLDISPLATGVYVLRLSFNNSEKYKRKWVVY